MYDYKASYGHAPFMHVFILVMIFYVNCYNRFNLISYEGNIVTALIVGTPLYRVLVLSPIRNKYR
jgi:hypothetical protein